MSIHDLHASVVDSLHGLYRGLDPPSRGFRKRVPRLSERSGAREPSSAEMLDEDLGHRGEVDKSVFGAGSERSGREFLLSQKGRAPPERRVSSAQVEGHVEGESPIVRARSPKGCRGQLPTRRVVVGTLAADTRKVRGCATNRRESKK